MAKTSYSTIKDLTVQELGAKGRELRQELFHLRIQQATARLEKSHRMRQLRKEIAHCETRLSEIRNNSQPKNA
ncbi:MAG: 50S ribosomal protein L29 [Verrucomicrobia bacterium]|nr:50S ribosomal protein L29 [Verrucomicrobiota bacterium]